MAESKNKLLSELRIMYETDINTPIGAQEIIAQLENKYGIKGVERRSIYKDMALLESAGFGIKRCTDKRKGWYTSERLFKDYELKILYDSIYNMKCITAENTKNILESLLSLTSERGRQRFYSQIILAMKNKTEEPELGGYIETIMEAIFCEKKVEFQYTEMDALMNRVIRREGKVYKLNPYVIYQSTNTYYLIGAHDNHDDPTSYRMDRIINLAISDEKWVSPQEKLGEKAEQVLQTYVEKSVDNYAGKEIKMVLEYIPGQITNNILYDFAGKDIKVKKVADGKVQATFKKNDSVTLLGWLLGYCNMFKVIEPDSLKERVLNELKNGVNNYES